MFNLEKGTIVLTSTGLSAETVQEEIKKLFDRLIDRSVVIITTAAEGKEKNKYSQLAKQQFGDIGFTKIDFYDLESDQKINFSLYDVVYVCGGNTFKLLKYARKTSFQDAIVELLNRNGIYIGVSAGSIILSPTIKLAATVDPDPNDVSLVDLTGLNLVDFETFPHYTDFYEKELIAYQQTSTCDLIRISNSQAVILTKNRQRIVG